MSDEPHSPEAAATEQTGTNIVGDPVSGKTPITDQFDERQVEAVARAAVASFGLDWDHRDQSYKHQSTEYARHGYWLPIAQAAITALDLPAIGVRFEVTEATLNHVSGAKGGVAGIYQKHDWKEEKRAALEAWARHVAAIIAPADHANVVPITTAKQSA